MVPRLTVDTKEDAELLMNILLSALQAQMQKARRLYAECKEAGAPAGSDLHEECIDAFNEEMRIASLHTAATVEFIRSVASS